MDTKAMARLRLLGTEGTAVEDTDLLEVEVTDLAVEENMAVLVVEDTDLAVVGEAVTEEAVVEAVTEEAVEEAVTEEALTGAVMEEAVAVEAVAEEVEDMVVIPITEAAVDIKVVIVVIAVVVVEAVEEVVAVVEAAGKGTGVALTLEELNVTNVVSLLLLVLMIVVAEVGRDGSGYGQGPPVPSAYGGPDNNYPPPPSSYGGNNNYPPDAVPPPASYGGGGASYPPSYGAPAGYGGNAPADARGGGRAGPPARFDGGYSGGAYGSSDEAPLKVKQCDENCGDSCDNSRIYISNLPPDVTIDELRELFGSIGQVARIKQKRGYKDQWPWSIKLYTDEQGNNKGDAVLSYEDPSAAHSAGGFFNNHMLRGNKISVVMAEKSAPKAAPAYGSRGGGRGGYGGGDRRRDNYRDGGSGPDRNYHGGNRGRMDIPQIAAKNCVLAIEEMYRWLARETNAERRNWVAPGRDMNPDMNGKSLQPPVGDFLTMQIKEH
nr:transcription initiation factor TFIID subunit 15B [Ipomoea batatas]